MASPKIGADCGGTGCPANYYYDPLLSPLSSALTYANSMQPSIIPVFQLFAQSSYLYGLDLDLSLNPNIYGYNRLVYTFVDSFNNIITAPLDADLANIATVTASVQTTTNPLNANETNVIVSGTAMYTLPSGMQPLPAGSPIYLYYDTNINFYNSIVSPADSDPTNYYQYSLQCAFSTSLQACQLANPLSTLTQPAGATNPKTFGPIEANVITFQTQYDYNAVDYRAGNPLAGTTVPQCAATPSSLLDLPACLLNRAKCECNINGDYGLDPIRSDPYNAKLDEYCEPVYDDGNGIFTSQIGLVAIANTLPDGTFNAVFDTCGSGTPSIVAQYYGYPPPEPLPVFQPSLPYSANAFLFEVPPSGFVTSNEFNYAYSPASQSASFNIGSSRPAVRRRGPGSAHACSVGAADHILRKARHAKTLRKGANGRCEQGLNALHAPQELFKNHIEAVLRMADRIGHRVLHQPVLIAESRQAVVHAGIQGLLADRRGDYEVKAIAVPEPEPVVFVHGDVYLIIGERGHGVRLYDHAFAIDPQLGHEIRYVMVNLMQDIQVHDERLIISLYSVLPQTIHECIFVAGGNAGLCGYRRDKSHIEQRFRFVRA